MTSVFWLGMVVLFGVVEALTVGLVSIWFALGAVAALLAAVLEAAFLTQLAVFAAVSAAALAATRPLARRYASGEQPRTNADRVLGGLGRVTEPVDGEQGAVFIDGKTWSARSEDGSPIPADAHVRVERMEGVKLYVTKA